MYFLPYFLIFPVRKPQKNNQKNINKWGLECEHGYVDRNDVRSNLF